ncbi:MAG: threonine synthase [Candidatus Dormibacteria bacterium]
MAYDFGAPQPATWRRRWHGRWAAPGEADRSGVWRYRELLPFLPTSVAPVTLGEGGTPLIRLERAAQFAGAERVWAKHLGGNPTGSFKDLGMTSCISQAVQEGARVVACASTGNTSASMAAYAARAGLQAVLFIPRGAVAAAKLAQALDFGARPVEVEGNFDRALELARHAALELGWYLVNSVNPYRLEGQKTAVVELLDQRRWRPPAVLVVPGGNLGNASALAKGLKDLQATGLLARLPRLVVVQAQGANPFFRLWSEGGGRLRPLAEPRTRASAIRIGNPASWERALRALGWTKGTCVAVSDSQIAEAKGALATDGVGCEPASATTLAGLRRLRQEGWIGEGEEVVLVLTGHQLKDVDYVLEQRRPLGPPAPALPAAASAATVTRQLRRWQEGWLPG